MSDSFLFLGKYDKNLHELEEKVLEQKIDELKESEYPDVLKKNIKGYKDNIWVVVGNVKPTLLLKELITNTKIIVFVFNLSDLNSLKFLYEGWGRIIEKVDINKPENQQRILVGINPSLPFNRQIILNDFQNAKEKLKFDQYFEESLLENPPETESIDSIPIQTNLIEFIKGQLTIGEANSGNIEVAVDEYSIAYKFYIDNQTAEVIESPSAKGHVTIHDSIIYKNNEYSITRICDKAFYESEIVSLTFEKESKIEVGSDCFCGAKNLRYITFAANELNIGDCCFKDCESLYLVTFKGISQLKIGMNAFENCQSLYNILMRALSSIEFGNKCFFGAQKLNSIELTAKELDIGDFCFENCASLKVINYKISDTVKIGKSAFENCKSLKSVEFSCSNNLSIDNCCFHKAENLQKVNLFCKENIVLGDSCFKQCSSLKTIQFQDSSYFYSSPNREKSVVNILFIGNDCFEDCTSLSYFNCENAKNVKIGKQTFKGCSQIEKLYLPEGEFIETDEECFSKMNRLSKFIIKSGNFLSKINFIKECKLLTHIEILNLKDLTISSESIQHCPNLQIISLTSNSKLTLKENCFSELCHLISVELSGNSILIREECFTNSFTSEVTYSKNFDKQIKINSKTIVDIEDNCFNSLYYLKSVEIIGENVSIGVFCFNQCNLLSSLQFPNSNEVLIGQFCFKDCSNLDSISFKGINYVEIGYESFTGCNYINNFQILPSTNNNDIKCFENIQGFETKGQWQIYLATKSGIKGEFLVKILNQANVPIEFQKTFFNRMIYLSNYVNPAILPISSFGFTNQNKNCFPTLIEAHLKYNSLSEVFERRIQLTSTQKYIILLGITCGMKYLHSLNVCHQNLSPENILLDKNFHPFIYNFCDFFQDEQKVVNQSNLYKIDIYSYSLILYEFITGKPSNHCKLTEIKDTKINELFKRCWLNELIFAPTFDDIFDEISSEKYRKMFKANEEEVLEYLESIDESDKNKKINEISVYVENEIIENNEKIILKLHNNKTAEIIQSENAHGEVFVPRFIEYQSKEYKITQLSSKAFINASIRSLSFSLNSMVEIISNYAFHSSKLQKLYIPASLTKLEIYWRVGADYLTQIVVDQNNPNFFMENEILYQLNPNDQTSEILFIPPHFSNRFTIPPRTTKICCCAFHKCNKLQSIMADSINLSLDPYSFYHCRNVENISLFLSSILNIDKKSFYGLDRLKYLGIKCQTLILNENFVEKCPSLQSIMLEIEFHLEIFPNVFKGCNSLSSLIINSKKSLILSENGISQLENLQSIEINCNQIDFNDGCIIGCPNLKSITIDAKSDLTISTNTFKGLGSLESIKLVSISSVKLSDYCFSSSHLQTAEFNSARIEFGNFCFNRSSILLSVKVKSSEMSIGNNCFANCRKLDSVSFEGITNASIGCNAFNKCYLLTKFAIQVSSSLTICNQCFTGSYLQSVYVQCNDLTVGDFILYECNSINSFLYKCNNICYNEQSLYGAPRNCEVKRIYK